MALTACYIVAVLVLYCNCIARRYKRRAREKRETKDESRWKSKSKDKNIERIGHAIQLFPIFDRIIIQLTSLHKYSSCLVTGRSWTTASRTMNLIPAADLQHSLLLYDSTHFKRTRDSIVRVVVVVVRVIGADLDGEFHHAS